MKSALLIASVSSMISKFNMDNIKILLSLGYRVTVATNFEIDDHTSLESNEKIKKDLSDLGVQLVQINFSRSATKLTKHIKSYKESYNLLFQEFDIIHTHTPIASAIIRLANIINKKSKSKIVYTAHGFHFYESAPLSSWLFYYPIERILARFTDTLITINKEDFERANNFKIKNVVYMPGVGVDINIPSLTEEEIVLKKKELSLNQEKVLLSVGELNNNKNHIQVIQSLHKIRHMNFKYLIVGDGPNKDKLLTSISYYDLNNKVELLGYRDDVQKLLQISDVFIFPSYREGLSKSLMEAMACGLPAVVSDIRGNRDLINDGLGGFLIAPSDTKGWSTSINYLVENQNIALRMGKVNREKVRNFDLTRVNQIMENIYRNL